MDFIKDVTKNMVYKVLNSDDCFAGAIRQKANFQNVFLVGTGTPDEDKVQTLIDTAPSTSLTKRYKRLFTNELPFVVNSDLPVLSVDKEDEVHPSQRQYNYCLLYAKDPQPRDLDGDINKDLKKGVYHFHIGTNRGLVKRIKFMKTDQPYMREARLTMQGFSGLSQLREPYKIEVEMYGNSKIFPGQTVYVDPRGLGYGLGSPATNGSMAWELGIGGYHMVINAKHSISSGKFDTRITCVWVLRGSAGGESTDTGHEDSAARNTTACEVLNNYGTPSGYVPPGEEQP
jgi:hypothetical protein